MYKEYLLKSTFRKLFSDHVFYTRQFIISLVDSSLQSKDVVYIVQRLMMNQEEIGNQLKPYYGEKKSLILTNLLKQHIKIAGDFVIANIKKDIKLSISKKTEWYMNAIEISKFFSQNNPKINRIIVRDMFFDHLDFTERELLARLRKDYALDIIMFDSVYEQILMLSDTLSESIIRQFKVRFRDDYKENQLPELSSQKLKTDELKTDELKIDELKTDELKIDE